MLRSLFPTAATGLAALLLTQPVLAQTSPAIPAVQTAVDAIRSPHAALAAITALLGDATLAEVYASRGNPLWTDANGWTEAGKALASELGRAGDYGLDVENIRVPTAAVAFKTLDEQAEHEVALTKAALAYANQARGGRVPDPSKISSSQDMNPTLIEPKAVLEALASSDDKAAVVRDFHPPHAGFKALQKAYVAARDSQASSETLARIKINLERWRWMPRDMGSFHVWNNVPEQITRVIKGGEVVHSERIVVGKPGHNTPVMSADMLYVIFHPSWGVPDGIKRNEIGPMLARASAQGDSLFSWGESSGRASQALARHELRAFHNGREVNPDTVDWRKVDVRQFSFTQPPSRKNVLGVVKFRFPNKFDVYMHDTQEKGLFAHGVRAYSHGCMRVQNPMKLAGVLLAHDKGWSQEKVDAFVPGGRSAEITLTTPIPVHLTYFTASADDDGKLDLHGDIYGMDARVGAALGLKSVALAAAKTSTQPSTPRASRATAAAAPRPVQAWNPFSSISQN